MNRQKVLYEGILVGLAGAAAVAVWFLVLDLVAGAPLPESQPVDRGVLEDKARRDREGRRISEAIKEHRAE